MRRIRAWLVVVPLMIAGTEAAHALAYRLVYPQASVRWRVLDATGHGYLAWAPFVFGVGAALVTVGVLAAVVDVVRGGPRRSVSPWVFGLLPLLGYALQEFLERWVALGGFPWWMVEQPTFRIGMLLQLPFALLAFVAARLLLRVAKHVGATLINASPRVAVFGQQRGWHPFELTPPRLSAVAGGHAVRGPPLAEPAPLRSYR